MEKENVTENVLFVYATKDNALSEEVQKFVETKHPKAKTLRLEDKLLDDLEKSLREPKDKPKTVEEFVSYEGNRDLAETKAMTLWNLLTHNGDYNKSLERIFTKSEIVKRTNLTNSKLSELLELFKLFGLIEYTRGTHEFRFVFSKETRKAGVWLDVVEGFSKVKDDIARYKSMYGEEDKEEMEKGLKELVKTLGL